MVSADEFILFVICIIGIFFILFYLYSNSNRCISYAYEFVDKEESKLVCRIDGFLGIDKNKCYCNFIQKEKCLEWKETENARMCMEWGTTSGEGEFSFEIKN